MGRSILAVLGGYFSMALGVTTFFAFVMFAMTGGIPVDPSAMTPPPWLVYVELPVSLLMAAGGGYVCAWIARKSEMKHAWALITVMLVLGFVSLFADQGMKPLWSSIAVALIGSVGVYLGTRLRLRVQA